jgi:hypothetical protein
MANGEDVVSEAARVGVMLLDPQIGHMVKQAIERMRGVRCRGGSSKAYVTF